ncbi:MAG: oligosaccharide flippase family protein [Planctomycetes bacterium]|nr:oligosaccharide flippase family protein [Planctomycetota bacterium]
MDKQVLKQIKNSDLFETLRHSKNYFSANVAMRAMAFISIPIFTRLLTEADYGVVAVFRSYVGIMAVLLSLNSYSAVGRYYYEKTDDFNEFLGTTLVFVGLIFCVTIPAFFIFYEQISNVIQLPGLLPAFLLFAALFAIINSVYQQVLIPQKRSKEAAVINVTKGYAVLIVAILLTWILKENRYLGRVWSLLLIGCGFSIYVLIKLSKYVKLCFRIEHIKYIASYSFPLIPYALSGVILAQFDRIMINNTIDTKSAGLYSLGYNIAMLILIVITSTRTALMPDFFKFLDNKEYSRIEDLSKKIFSIITVAALGLIFFAKEIVILLADKKFHPGLSVVPVVVVGYLFYGMATVYNRYIAYAKKTIYLSVIVLAAGILNIVLNLIFIPKYGYIAAAYTTVASYFVMFLLTWIVSKVFIEQKTVRLWTIWKPTLLMFAFIGLVYLVEASGVNAVWFFLIKAAMLATFCCIVFRKQLRTVLRLRK